MWFGVGMAQVFTGAYQVSHQLFELFYFREPAVLLSVEYDSVVEADVKISTRFTGFERYGPELIVKSGEEFLCHISRPQQPVAFGAICDGNGWFHIEFVY